MNVLLDESVPWPAHKLLIGHTCTSVQRRGWKGMRNGALLPLAEGEFDLFITSDQNLRYLGSHRARDTILPVRRLEPAGA